MCTAHRCWLISKTMQGMGKHMKDNQESNTIDRMTYHGVGIRRENVEMSDSDAMFNMETQQWKRPIRDFKRDKYQRYQVFGEIAATHGYTARVANSRRNIPLGERHIMG